MKIGFYFYFFVLLKFVLFLAFLIFNFFYYSPLGLLISLLAFISFSVSNKFVNGIFENSIALNYENSGCYNPSISS